MNLRVDSGGRWIPALAVGFACAAQAAPGSDPLAWLDRAVHASRATAYSGTFVHTNGDRISTVRITHSLVGNDEQERIEPLDGPPYEIVRRNDEMFCYFPDAKTVRLDRRVTARFFPSVLSAPAATLAASYDVKLGSSERVLGYDCQWIRLEPKDAMRFAQRVCSEIGTGLIVRAKTFNDHQQVLEQYTFTELHLGAGAAKSDVRSIFEARVKRWTTDAQPREEAKGADTGWIVGNPPQGFRKVSELRRTLPGRAQPVSQIVYSDGASTMSVFVEPNGPPARTEEASSEDGTTTFFVRPMGGNVVTVLGEVPLAAAQQVGRSVAHRP